MRTISNSISRFGLFAILALLPAFAVADAAQYVGWGNQMIAAKKYDDALKYFGGAIKADPKNAAAYKGMGYAYVYKGDKAHAVQYLNYAAQLNPSDTALKQYVATLGGGSAAGAGATAGAQAYQNGVRYMQAKQYQYAAYYFNQATQTDAGNAKAWQGLGNAFYAQGNKAKAIEAWDKAVALDPSNTQLASYVASLKGAPAATASAEAAPAAAAGTEGGGEEKKAGFNPWIMGGTVAALGAVMLFLF